MDNVDIIARLLILPVVFVVDPVAPLLVFAWATRLGLVTDPALTGPAFAGFGSDAFLICLTAVYLGRVLADKSPLIAHAMDLVGLVLKPLMTAFVGFYLADQLDAGATAHWAALSIVLLCGVPAAFSLQALRAKVRLGASVGTVGLAHPILSTVENVAGMVLAYMAVMHPVAALVLTMAVGIPVVWLSTLAVRAAGRTLKAGWRRVASPRNRASPF